MKIYYNSKIARLVTFLADFATVMLFGAVFTELPELSIRSKYHEAVHVEQYQTCFSAGLALAVSIMFTCFAFNAFGWWMLSLVLIPVFLYYAWYGIEYLIRLIQYRDRDRAYRMISFEREAYDLENEYLKPCNERRTASSFSFVRYYKKVQIL